MNLKFVFRIFAGIIAVFALGAILAPDAMTESYGITLTDGAKLIMQFTVIIQLMIVIIVWQLPSWLGDDLAKAGPTMIVVSLLPVVMNIYHVVIGALPASGAQIVESGIWIVFAGLFYFYSKGKPESVDTP